MRVIFLRSASVRPATDSGFGESIPVANWLDWIMLPWLEGRLSNLHEAVITTVPRLFRSAGSSKKGVVEGRSKRGVDASNHSAPIGRSAEAGRFGARLPHFGQRLFVFDLQQTEAANKTANMAIGHALAGPHGVRGDADFQVLIRRRDLCGDDSVGGASHFNVIQ